MSSNAWPGVVYWNSRAFCSTVMPENGAAMVHFEVTASPAATSAFAFSTSAAATSSSSCPIDLSATKR